MGKYFGTDGFRSEANIGLTGEHAYKIGRFLGWYYSKEKPARILIGKDTRRSGYMLEYGLACGITASGGNAFLAHVTTTPCTAFLTKEFGFDCGIMISASHNPYYDNGIKLISGSGSKMDSGIEDEIEAYIDKNDNTDIPFARRADIGRVNSFSEGKEAYLSHLKAAAEGSFEGFHIAVDCANGSASSYAAELFKELGAEVDTIFDKPDGVNINDGCGSTHPESLQRYVAENALDMGFAFDGDADRCIAVDGNGNIVDGDVIMYVCGKHLKEKGELKDNTVVTTVMSNIGLYKAFDKEGMSYSVTQVGDRNVYEEMEKNGYLLGGEQSGHIIFMDHASTGDGMLTAIMVMNACMAQKRMLSGLASEVKILPQLLKNVKVKDKKASLNNPRVISAVERAKECLAGEGRILVRASGTEQLVRVMVEASDDAECLKYVDEVIRVLKEEE